MGTLAGALALFGAMSFHGYGDTSGSPRLTSSRVGEPSIIASLGGRKFDRNRVSLKVVKSQFLLQLRYRGHVIKTYPVVLGTDPIHNKLREGDGCTPEGEFRIVEIRAPHKWSKFMLINYPTRESRRRFSAAKRDGIIPADSTVGGAVGIHGVPTGFDSAIRNRQNWTAGCISLTTRDIDEVSSVCRPGTPVTIVH